MEWIAEQDDTYYETIDPPWAFSLNPSAVAYLEAHPEKMIMGNACANPKLSAKLFYHMLQTFPIDLLDYRALSFNPSDAVVDYMINNPQRIDWDMFSGNSNPKAVALLQQHYARINWSWLSMNECDAAVRMLEKNQHLIDFDALSSNSNSRAVKLLSLYPERIHYGRLAGNKNPLAMNLLMQNDPEPEYMNWYALSKNPAAMDILKANPDKINFISFWRNPAIFEIDY